MKIWFTGDQHWSHANVIRYCMRPFPTLREHDEALIANWNSRVGQKDTVYHLGDFGFGSKGYMLDIMKRLNGTIHLIRGNHDRKIKGELLNRFASVDYYKEIKVQIPKKEPQRIILCHYPIESWNAKHFGSWQLHGHCHGKLKASPKILRIDVGVDCCNYFPISFEEVQARMEAIKNYQVGVRLV